MKIPAKMIGVWVPRPRRAKDPERKLRDLADGRGRLDDHRTLSPQVVLKLEDGRHARLVEHDGQLLAMPFRGRPKDRPFDPEKGGFLPVVLGGSAPSDDLGPLLQAAAVQVTRDQAVPSEEPTAEQHREEGQEDDSPPEWPFNPYSQAIVGNALATLMAGGSMNNALVNGIGNPMALGGVALSQALSKLTGRLMDGWELDDNSSTAEFAAKAAAQQVIGKLQQQAVSMVTGKLTGAADGPGMAEKIGAFFGPVQSNATLEAAHLCSPDDMGNAVCSSTASTVLVNGKIAAAALSGDVVLPAGKPVVEGSTTVKLCEGGLMFARESSKTAVPSALCKSGVNVLIGGPSPHPAATAKATEIMNDSGDAELANKESNRINRAAMSAEKDALANGATPEEARHAADEAAAMAAEQKPVDPFTMRQLIAKTYEDGKPGVFSDKKPPLEANKTVTVNGEDWTPLEIHDSSTGFRAVLWQRADGQEVLIFSGTNFTSGADWWTNIMQGLGLNIPGLSPITTPQYQQALQLAQEHFSRNPSILIGGHSLGGGLATFAASMVGADSIGFNSAGMGTGSTTQINNSGLPHDVDQHQVFVVDDDILTDYSTTVGQPEPYGTVYTLPNNPDAQNVWPAPGVPNHQGPAIDWGLGEGPIDEDVVPPPVPPPPGW